MKANGQLEPKDVRVGNFVRSKLGNWLQLKQIPEEFHPGDFAVYPIPLTPEILTNSLGPGWNIKTGLIDFWKDQFVFGFADNEYGMDYEEATGIKYLHQLQNLYFALTGEELNIEL